MKDEGKEEDGESEIEVIKQIGGNPQRRNSTRTECNYYAIGPNGGDKNQATNGLQRRTKVGQGLTNGAGSKLRSQTDTSAGGTGRAVKQTVNLRGEGVIQDHRPDTVKDTVFNLLSRMQAVVLILLYTCFLGMDLILYVKFLAHNTGLKLSQLEGRLAGNGCSLRSKFPHQEIRRWC